MIVEQNLKSLYSSVALQSAALMQDTGSRVFQELSSLPPLNNYLDYQKFKNKEIQGQDALGENANYVSLLILLRKYEESFETQLEGMKATQIKKAALMKGDTKQKDTNQRRVSVGSQGGGTFQNSMGEQRDGSADNSPTFPNQSGMRKN